MVLLPGGRNWKADFGAAVWWQKLEADFGAAVWWQKLEADFCAAVWWQKLEADVDFIQNVHSVNIQCQFNVSVKSPLGCVEFSFLVICAVLDNFVKFHNLSSQSPLEDKSFEFLL